MAKKVAVTNLNARTIDILNTIRANLSASYQSQVPEVTKDIDIPKVGEVLYGYPALANQFLTELVNRIALVRVKSATFNNAYAELKKGYLEFGETVEEVFVNICKAREFSAEKAESRELKRSLPDVRSAFHSMNWRVQYPVTIQDEDLRMAFLNADGVQDLIAKIVNSVSVAAEYDEFLLFKYLIIKAAAHGKMAILGVDYSNMDNAAIAFRGASNKLEFMSTKFNESGVHTVTKKADQCIFMDADFNAKYDVSVLAAAFNMDKAEFMGKLYLIDDWTSFDNQRFSDIMDGSDMISLVTNEELAIMQDIHAVVVDKEWFQIYDNQNKFTEKYVASGEYWNYFYNVWKTVSTSPFSNAIAFVNEPEAAPASIQFEVTDKTVGEGGTVLVLELANDDAVKYNQQVRFTGRGDSATAMVAIHKYGAIVYPPNAKAVNIYANMGGTTYRSTSAGSAAGELPYTTVNVGDKVTFVKV